MAAPVATSLDDAFGEADDLKDLDGLSADQIRQRQRLLENDCRVMKSEEGRLTHESNSMQEKIKDNKEKIKLNKQLPFLVGNVSEILELEEDQDEDCKVQNCDHTTPMNPWLRAPSISQGFVCVSEFLSMRFSTRRQFTILFFLAYPLCDAFFVLHVLWSTCACGL